MKNNIEPIAIIDCSIQRSAIRCYNQIVQRWNYPFTYHRPSEIDINYLADHNARAYIIFGSASNVHERLPWHHDLTTIIRKKLETNIPVFGICFAHQLIADLFGSTIAQTRSDGEPRIGIRKISIINNGHQYKKGETFLIIVAHSYEIKTLSSSFTHLAQSEECFYDAIHHNDLPFLSFQGHPEASLDFIKQLELQDSNSPSILDQAMASGTQIIDRFINSVLIFNKNFLLKTNHIN